MVYTNTPSFGSYGTGKSRRLSDNQMSVSTAYFLSTFSPLAQSPSPMPYIWVGVDQDSIFVQTFCELSCQSAQVELRRAADDSLVDVQGTNKFGEGQSTYDGLAMTEFQNIPSGSYKVRVRCLDWNNSFSDWSSYYNATV